METERVFSPLLKDDGKGLESKLSAIENSCNGMNLIEEIVLYWVDSRRSLTIGLNTYLPFPCIGVSFNEKGKDIALYSIPTDEILTRYREFQPLNESIVEFSDQEGFRPDDAWFDKRNYRLKISVREDLGLNFSPPSALSELTLSYALSSAGFSRFEIFAKKGKSKDKYIKGSFIYLGKDLNNGWAEEIYFSLEELSKYVKDSIKPGNLSKGGN